MKACINAGVTMHTEYDKSSKKWITYVGDECVEYWRITHRHEFSARVFHYYIGLLFFKYLYSKDVSFKRSHRAQEN